MPSCVGVKNFVLQNFLILGLLTVIALGLLFPGPGLSLQGVKLGPLTLPDIAIDIIFVVSGMCLDSVSDALQPKALSLGIFLVLGVTPLLAWPILNLIRIDPSLNYTLLQGMALFCIVPTTLSSGVTMITQAKGNVSLAILLTSVTNVLGVFTMSWSSSLVFSKSVNINPIGMLGELIWLTLVPLIVGMTLRRNIAALEKFAKAYKKTIRPESEYLHSVCCVAHDFQSTRTHIYCKPQRPSIVPLPCSRGSPDLSIDWLGYSQCWWTNASRMGNNCAYEQPKVIARVCVSFVCTPSRAAKVHWTVHFAMHHGTRCPTHH